MVSRIVIPITSIFLMYLAGCDQKEMLRRLTPTEEDKMARAFLEDVRGGDLHEAESLISNDVAYRDAALEPRELVEVLKGSELRHIEMIGANTSFFSTGGYTRKTVNLSYQVELSKGWLVGSFVITEEGGSRRITGARFYRNSASLEEINRFTFAGKGLIYYVFLSLAITIPVFIIAVLVICVRSKIRRKWLWVLFILLGFVSFRLNWATGQLDWQLINFQLLGAGVSKFGIYAPWIISVSLPIGAIVFLDRRSRLNLVSAPAEKA